MSSKDMAAVEVAAAEAAPGAGLDVRIAAELLERARAEGVSLVGQGGLLQQVTRAVLQTALEAEMAGHLGYERGEAPPPGSGSRQRPSPPPQPARATAAAPASRTSSVDSQGWISSLTVPIPADPTARRVGPKTPSTAQSHSSPVHPATAGADSAR